VSRSTKHSRGSRPAPGSQAWWRNISDGDHVGVSVIQFDLGGHSVWSVQQEAKESRPDVYLSRKGLQERLRAAVAGFGFSMHHWAGDGGVFVGRLPTQPMPTGHIRPWPRCSADSSNGRTRPSRYRLFDLREIPVSQVDPSFFQTDEARNRWDSLASTLRRDGVIGTKFRIHSLEPPFIDDPMVRVKWSQGSYVDSYAFHTMLLEQPEFSERYLGEALTVMQGGTRIPNLLSNHSVVVFGNHPDRQVLLCHRRRGQRPGGYTRNCWSVSCEEQYNPVENNISGKTFKQDRDIFGALSGVAFLKSYLWKSIMDQWLYRQCFT